MYTSIRNLKSLLLISLLVLGLVSCGNKSNSDGTDSLTCLEDLKGHSVGVILGSTADILLNDYEGIEVFRYGTPTLVLQSLDLGKIDAILVDSAITINASLAERGMHQVFGGVEPAEACFGFNYNDQELCDQFNAYLAGLKADGSYEAIKQKWTSGTVHGVEMPVLEYPEDAEPLNVGILGGDIPFAFVTDNGFAGMEPELLEGFAHSIGRKVVYHEYEFAALAAGLQSGRISIISALMFNTPERAKVVLFSDSYFQSANVCIVNDDTAGKGVSFWGRVKSAFYNNLVYESRYKIILEGLWVTLVISFWSILLGTVLGAFLAWRSYSRRKKFWHGFLKVYGDIMHGVPLLVILMMMFYVVFASSRLSAIWISIITFAIYFGYASCEIFISGVDGVGKGQTEAARSLGFTKFGAFRYVTLPQAIKRIIPFYEGEAVTLLKETSLVGFIAVVDLTKATDIVQSRTFDAFFPLIIAAVIYFIIAWLISLALKCLISKQTSVK